MRILHTSDWHLGSSLDGVSRDEDHALFLGWLKTAIERERVDVLVVAGDVFDQAHPSAEAQRLFFAFLRAISQSGLRKVVIVGGNHDSPSRLDAPRTVLDALEVHVVGGLSADEASWERCICPIPGESGGVEAVVLAVPFVHEFRLGVRTGLAGGPEIRAAFTAAFKDRYRRLLDEARARHDGAPAIATGHLTCDGYEKDDFPIDIHMVGSIGGLPAEIFDERLQYVALGHIHRSYRVGNSRAYYSGTPLALGLKEAKTARTVRLVELSSEVEAAATVSTLEVPSFRKIVELTGAPDDVASRLRALTWDTELPPIVYARALVTRYSSSVEETLRSAVRAHGQRAPRLVELRQVTLQAAEVQRELVQVISLKELCPEEVFLRLCQDQQEPADPALMNAFRSLLSAAPEEDAQGPAQVAK